MRLFIIRIHVKSSRNILTKYPSSPLYPYTHVLYLPVIIKVAPAGTDIKLAWIISFIQYLTELMVSGHAHVIFVGHPTI